MIKAVCGIILLALCLNVSCIKNDKNCSYDACAYKAPDTEVQMIETYLAANNITAVKHCSGLYYQIESPGSGASPSVCSAVSFSYTGRLTNGNVFDQSATPVTFYLMELIEGWKKGMPLIMKGGKIKLFIPPSLGYGSQQTGSIPGNSVLIFDIVLVDVI